MERWKETKCGKCKIQRKKPICNSCRDYNKFVPMTNADRIREMSDEELMKIIMCPYDISGIPVNMMPCVRNGNIQELIPPEECNKCMMEWLQSGVEE